jgi:hypothetical protein
VNNHILRHYKRIESPDYGEESVILKAIGWELYALEVNGHEEKRCVGLDNAMNMLEDWNSFDDGSWIHEKTE